uniref:Bestrophin homolog n=1 Tax=Plectus sambesii TaxID=2011161 RepID=A0A914X3D7_9BILA
MVFRDISPVVRRRFPDDHAFKTAGFLTEQELSAMESVTSPHAKYWLPIHWAFHLIKEAKASGLIRTERAVELVQARLLEFRTSLAKQRAAHGVPVPLAYTQVVFIAVRSYLALTMIGQQYVIGDRHKEILTPIDIYIPLLSILQLLFYLGWVKVAEGLLNPYGDDDDDFECNWFIDRNLQVGFSIVDGAIGKEPPLEKDVFWNEIIPLPLYANGVLNAPIHVQNDSIPKPIRLVEKIIRSSLTSEKINSTVAEHNLESQGNCFD